MILPHPDDIRAAREAIGLTPAQAAEIVHVFPSDWEAYEAAADSANYRLISAATWHLFLTQTEKLRPEGSRWGFSRKGPPFPD